MPPKRKSASTTAPATPATRKPAAKRAKKAHTSQEQSALEPTLSATPGEENRLARFRATPPKATKERIARVLSQRFFCVAREKTSPLSETFHTLGSTGNVYTVEIRNKSRCNCPDRDDLCKHILFVLLKILKIPPTSPLVWQAALLDQELAVIFENAPQTAQDRVSAQLSLAYRQATGTAAPSSSTTVEHVDKRIPTGDDDSCPICYEGLEQGQMEGLVFCVGVGGCGNPIHVVCQAAWAKQATPITCVFCRAPWPAAPGSAVKRTLTSPYVNLAAEAGISPARNTSSYYTGPVRGGWRREEYYDDF